MSNENKEILDQVTELISSKKEMIKGGKMEDKNDLKKFSEIKVENTSENSQDLLIKREIEKWIKKNAEKLAKAVTQKKKSIYKNKKVDKINSLKNKLKAELDTNISITINKKESGNIKITFSSYKHLKKIIKQLIHE